MPFEFLIARRRRMSEDEFFWADLAGNVIGLLWVIVPMVAAIIKGISSKAACRLLSVWIGVTFSAQIFGLWNLELDAAAPTGEKVQVFLVTLPLIVMATLLGHSLWREQRGSLLFLGLVGFVFLLLEARAVATSSGDLHREWIRLVFLYPALIYLGEFPRRLQILRLAWRGAASTRTTGNRYGATATPMRNVQTVRAPGSASSGFLSNYPTPFRICSAAECGAENAEIELACRKCGASLQGTRISWRTSLTKSP